MFEPQQRSILIATILASSLAFIDASVVNVILPSIKIEFQQDLSRVQWVIHSYGLFLSTFLLLGGVLGDRFGRKRMFQLGLMIFLVGSFASGISPSLDFLLLARATQGFGAALLTPESLSIIEATFTEKSRPHAIGIWSSFSAVTGAMGPPLGGILSDHFGWRTVFLINIPLGLAAFWVAKRSIPHSCSETLSSKLDIRGTLISTLGVGSLILGLTQKSFALILLGLIILALFLVVEHRSRDPLLPLSAFRSRNFSVSNAFTFFLYLPLGATFFFLPFHWISVDGYSAAKAGAAVLPTVLSIFALSPVSGMLSPKLGAKTMLSLGAMITGLGNLTIFRLLQLGHHSYWNTYLPGLLLIGIGMSILITPLTSTAIDSLGKSRSGLASGFNNAVARLAGLFGVAGTSLLISSENLAANHFLFLANGICCGLGLVLGLRLEIHREA